VKNILSFILLLSFSTSLVFSSVHHLAEEHEDIETCNAPENGEKHLHNWEFEDCQLCDLQTASNYLKAKLPYFTFSDILFKKYYSPFREIDNSTHYRATTTRGPPTA